IADIGELIERQLPVRLSRMSTHEDQLTILWPVRIPFQEMLDLGRLSVFVRAKNADIQIVTRILEVIRIAAVKRDLLFRREHEPDVVVALESIKMIGAALIKCDDVRAQPRFFFALL